MDIQNVRGRSTRAVRLDRDRGAVLPMVLVLIIIGALVVLPIMTYTTSVLRANRVEAERTSNTEAAKGAVRAALKDPGTLFTGCPTDASQLLPHGAVEDIPVGIACDPLDELSAEEVFGLDVPIGAAKLQVGPPSANFDGWEDGVLGEVANYESAMGATVPPYTPDANQWWATYQWTNPASDPSVPAAPLDIWLPSLPTYTDVDRSPIPFSMPGAFDCEVYLPGHYPDGLTIDSSGNFYFASGVYYFEDEVVIRGGADVVIGQGLADFGFGNDCADDVQVGANVTVAPGTVYAIDGNTGGATWVFGDNGRLVIDDTGGAPNVRFNQRYAPPDRGGWINIMSVNGDWSYDNGDDTDDDEAEDAVGDHSATNVSWVPRSTVRTGETTLPIDSAPVGYVPSSPSLTDEARRPQAPSGVGGVALIREVSGEDDGAIVVSFTGVEGAATNGAIIDDYEVGISTSSGGQPTVRCSVSSNSLWPTTESPAGLDPWGRAQGAIGENAADPDGFSCLVTRLAEDETHWISVRAHNEAGWSDWTSQVAVAVPASAPAAEAPDPVSNITFEGYGADGALISWDPSIDAGRAPVQGYEVTVYRVTQVELTGITPSTGPESGGTVVTIEGSGFATATGVTFDGLPAAFSVDNDNQITATSPPHAPGVVAVHVEFDGSSSLPGSYTYEDEPLPGASISSISPPSGPEAGATSVTITGSGFTTATAVTFDGTPGASLSVVSDTELTVSTPAGVGTVPVVVMTPDGDSTPVAFSYDPPDPNPPSVDAVVPSGGPHDGGNTVTITGSHLAAVTSVSFGGVLGSNLVVVSDSELTVDAPAHPTGDATVDLIVSSSAGASVPLDYSYDPAPTPPPVINTVSPSSGPTSGGTTVTLTGSNFTGATGVTFGGTAATNVTVVDDTRITAVTPARAAGAADVVVTGASAPSNTVTFTYSANTPTPPPVACEVIADDDFCDEMPDCPTGQSPVIVDGGWQGDDWDCEPSCYNGETQYNFGWNNWGCAPPCPPGEQPDYSWSWSVWAWQWGCDPINCSGGRTGVYAYGATHCYRPGPGFASPLGRGGLSPFAAMLAAVPTPGEVSEEVGTCSAAPLLGRGDDAALEWTPLTQCTIDSLPPLGPSATYRVEVTAVSATGTTATSVNAAAPAGTGVVADVPYRVWYPYEPSPVISIATSGAATTVQIPGYVAVPMGRLHVDNAAGAPVEIAGGVVAGTFDIEDSRSPAPFGFQPSVVMQRTIRLVTTAGNITSTAVIRINSDTNYGITRWVTQ